MLKKIEDPDFGEVLLKKNIRSKRYVIRIKSGVVSVSLPIYGSYKTAKEFLDLNRQSLLLHVEKQKQSKPQVLLSEEEVNELRKQASQYLPERLKYWAKPVWVLLHCSENIKK